MLRFIVLALIFSSALGALTTRTTRRNLNGNNPQRSWGNTATGGVNNPRWCNVGEGGCTYVASDDKADKNSEDILFSGKGYYEGRHSQGGCSAQDTSNPTANCDGSSNGADGGLLNLGHDLTVLRGPFGVHVATSINEKGSKDGTAFDCWRLDNMVSCGTGVTSKNGADEVTPCPNPSRYYEGWECNQEGAGCDPDEQKAANANQIAGQTITEMFEIGAIDGTLYVLGGTEAYEMTLSVSEYAQDHYCYGRSIIVATVWESDPASSLGSTGSAAAGTGIITNASAALGNAFGLSGGFSSLNDFMGAVMGSATGDVGGSSEGHTKEMNDIHLTEFVGGKKASWVSLSKFASMEAAEDKALWEADGADLQTLSKNKIAPVNCAVWGKDTKINGDCGKYCSVSFGGGDNFGCVGDANCNLSGNTCKANAGCSTVCASEECVGTTTCASASKGEFKVTDVTIGSYVNGGSIVVSISENSSSCYLPWSSSIDGAISGCRRQSGCEWDITTVSCRTNLANLFTYNLGNVAGSFSDTSNIKGAKVSNAKSVSFSGLSSLQTNQCFCDKMGCQTQKH